MEISIPFSHKQKKSKQINKQKNPSLASTAKGNLENTGVQIPAVGHKNNLIHGRCRISLAEILNQCDQYKKRSFKYSESTSQKAMLPQGIQ